MTKPAKIIQFGHGTLRQRAQAIPPDRLADPEITNLIEQLKITIPEHGVGLAAPQINYPWRVFLADLHRDSWSDEETILTICINPKITACSSKIETDWEGCLSAPGIWGQVPRPATVSVSYLTEGGQSQSAELSGVSARVFQHELDHLDGILFVDRMADMKTLITDEEFEKIRLETRGNNIN